MWRKLPGRLRYEVAVLAVEIAIGALYLPVIGKGTASVLFLAVLISAWFGGLGPGLLATGLTVAAAVALLVYYGVEFLPERIVSLVLFAGGGVLITLLVEGLHAARRRAEEANRAKDRFLAVLSHELRTPLAPVLMHLSALLEDPRVPGELRPALELTRRHVELEARLIDDLLDISRILRGRMPLEREVIDVHEQIQQAVDTCRDGLRAGQLELVVDLAAPEPYVEADPVRLQQVLWNLIKNAIKFTPPGGSVTVRTRATGGDNGAGRWLTVEVSDTGVGIAPAVLPRIFDAFEQGEPTSWNRRARGLGLGLAISRSIVEAHGGRLTAASAGPGQGATFTLELRTVPAPSATAPSRPPATDGLPLSRELKILLVEDDEATLKILARLLRQRGYTVMTAGSVADGLEAAARDEPDLVISDLGLPDGDGLELMQRLRARRAIAGIAVSGFGMEDDIRKSREAGFVAHLTKPVDFRKLEATIQRVSS